MKWNFNDPTGEKDDMLPLTPEECKAIYIAGGVMLALLVISSFIIYLMSC
jgi:hypothetical protein